jgi:hypothetical protein
MPAGFGRFTIAPTSRNGWPGPHLRTGDVTLVFTTDETCSNILKLLLWERHLQQIPLPMLGEQAATVCHLQNEVTAIFATQAG